MPLKEGSSREVIVKSNQDAGRTIPIVTEPGITPTVMEAGLPMTVTAAQLAAQNKEYWKHDALPVDKTPLAKPTE
jgi:hypothetical protein